MHREVGEADGAGQPVGRDGKLRTGDTDQWQRGFRRGLHKVAGNDVDRAAAGDFTCPMSAHPVAHDEQAGGRIGMKPVLVAVAREADILTKPHV